MKLTFDQIKSITFGATSIEYTDGMYRFHRFGTEVEKMYEQYAPEKYGASMATTGTLIDFITDSKNVSFSVFNAANDEGRYFIDAYVNDLLALSYHPTKDRTPHTLTLGEGESRVRIYFDSHTICKLDFIEIDDGASIRPTPKGERALIFGDSITQGARCNHTSLSYANLITEHFGWNATSFAIGGDIFREWIPGTVPLCDPDIITVAYGTNDWNSETRESIDAAARGFFARIRSLYPKARIFYISPVWRRGYTREVASGSFADNIAILESIAKEYGAETIRGWNIVPHMEEFFDDGLHPNDFGYGAYARVLIKELEARGVRK